MTDLEARAEPVRCPAAAASGPCLQLWPEREVPLGGIRGLTVSRTLPQRGLPTVGAWCFLDSFGPSPAQMAVLPHPHIGLQTVTWPLSGTIRHRDSVGSDVLVRPGELNLMTAGYGVAHSEYSWLEEPKELECPDEAEKPENEKQMRGLQFWIALPEESRNIPTHFEQHRNLPVFEQAGLAGTVLLGEFAGRQSPATTYSPLVGVELSDATGGQRQLPLEPGFEHAVLVLDGVVRIDDQELAAGPLGFLGSGRDRLVFDAQPGTRLMLFGGAPFAEDLVMWWNFAGRSHEDIVEARAQWEAQDPRFPLVPGQPAPRETSEQEADAGRIPAPPLPGVRLTPRKRN
ncbi:pirin family protein [Acaricomes phytoseiuli]|uniref:pirin family protein n=1 Tax=Acaricomes phytoseiuli TaxID=291968 RepID=UPI00037C82D1|nr:pirin family protein [Acaricomes phytoseiuli]MCW1250166.1 pirin family protein [Acaricomes phytoseiuli]